MDNPEYVKLLLHPRQNRGNSDLDLSNGKERRRSIESRKTEINELAISDGRMVALFRKSTSQIERQLDKD